MTDGLRIFLAVLILTSLLVIFVVSFILYRKTPLPKGCEDMQPSEEKCANCKEEGHLNIYAEKKKKENEKK